MLTFLGGAVASTMACAWTISGCWRKGQQGGGGAVFQRIQGRGKGEEVKITLLCLLFLLIRTKPVGKRKPTRKSKKLFCFFSTIRAFCQINHERPEYVFLRREGRESNSPNGQSRYVVLLIAMRIALTVLELSSWTWARQSEKKYKAWGRWWSPFPGVVS